MLILNGKQFISTGTGDEQKTQRNHYNEAVQYIRSTYGKDGCNQMITLIRRKEPKRDSNGALEETAPLIFPAKAYPTMQFSAKDQKSTSTIGGLESWAYSKNKPVRKNAGDDYEPEPKSIKFMSFAQGFNLDTDIDLIYFLLYKSPKVYYPPAIAQGKVKKGDLMVEDRALRAKEKVAKERDMLKLKNAIMAPDVSYPLYGDENLRKVAAAWGIDGAMDQYQSVDELRFRLEHSVQEAEKAKTVTGSGKGLVEFFELFDFDDSVRQRALISYAIDNKKIKWDDKANRYVYTVNSGVLLEVPDNKKYHSFDFLADYLANEMHDKDWINFKSEVVDQGYIEMLSFDDLKWLAKQNEISLNQKSAASLREDLCKVYCG